MFLHHPDGFILVGALSCALEEFLIDEPAYALPDGTRGRCYQPGIAHWLTDGSTQHAGPLPWPEGDAYLAKEAEYRLAQEARRMPPQPSLDELKAGALRSIDATAENRRLAYITPGSGQAMVYQEKRREAEAALAALAGAGGQPVDPAQFPLLAAELSIAQADLQGLAEMILAKAREWSLAAAAIESTRLSAKRDVAAAATAAEIEAILSAVAWGA